MSANSSERSKVILFDPKAQTENYKRSSHNDFATSSELRARKFDGWRMNKLEDTLELWVDGEIVRRITALEILSDPDKPNKVFKEYFQLD